MRILVIGNQAAVWGFALTGVAGEVVTTAVELRGALEGALQRQDVGIVLVTEDVARLDREWLDALQVRTELPLILEIPAPGGGGVAAPRVDEVLRRTLGINLPEKGAR